MTVRHAAHYWLLHPLLGSCKYKLATNAAATSETPCAHGPIESTIPVVLGTKPRPAG